MIEGHLRQGNFSEEIIALGTKLVDATLELHRNVMNNFLPSAIKFHYQYNLRDLSAITQVATLQHYTKYIVCLTYYMLHARVITYTA